MQATFDPETKVHDITTLDTSTSRARHALDPAAPDGSDTAAKVTV